MPSPLEILLDPISMLALSIYTGVIFWEFCFPARELTKVPYWVLRGTVAFFVYFYLSTYLPLWWDEKLQPLQLLDVSTWPVLAQVTAGLFAYEFCVYAYHRFAHSSPIIWRAFHQMHHSAERVDTFGAFWFSPLDMIAFTFLGSFAFVVLVGMNSSAATCVLLLTLFLGVFQHANIRTPRWLGYIIQRPESHSYHHSRGHHRDNYADIPIIDIVFGTFYNPRGFCDTGFYHGASNRVIDMMLWRDVYKPRI